MSRDSSSSHVDTEETARLLHSGMVRLLRRLARRDTGTGLSPARLSALSVLVFRGRLTLSQLAAAERVRPPTMSLIVRGLESQGLVERRRHPSDGRAFVVRATRRGRSALKRGQDARIESLERLMSSLSAQQRKHLAESAELLLGLASGPDR